MAISIVTQGYLYSAMLILGLALAGPKSLGFRKAWETKLAMALGLGLFVVAMFVWAEMFPISDLSMLEAVLP